MKKLPLRTWIFIVIGAFIIGGIYWYYSHYRFIRNAVQILENSGIEGGLIVHMGFNTGKLTAALHANDHYIVHGISSEEKKVEKARRYIHDQELYGEVSVKHWDKQSLPYTSDLVNLLVLEQPGRVSENEMMRVLAPQGVALIKKNGKWEKTVKPRPEEIDEWTHFLHDASNNAVSHDSRVGPPQHLRWKAGPLWARSHSSSTSTSTMVSANGRIFSIVDFGLIGFPDTRFDRWRLCARDASNGLKLWEREMPDWGPDVWEAPRYWSSPPTLTRRLVAIGERVFVTLGYKAPVSVLDASTGEVLKTLGQTTNTDEILWSDSVLIVRRRKKIPASTGGHTWDTQVLPNDNNEAEIPSVAVGEQTIMAVDPESGETLWKWPETQMVTLSLAAHNGRVCYHNFEQIVCLDLETGKKLWSVDSPAWPERMGTAGTLVMHGDMVLYTNDRDLQAISASKGEIEWRGPRIIQSSPWQPPDLLVADSLIWGSLTPSAANNPFPAVRSPYASLPPNPWFRQSVDEAMEKRIQSPKEPDWLQGPEPKGINPNTGKIERVIDMGNLVTQGHHVRCYRSKATDNYLLYNKRGIEFVGIKEGTDHARCNWTRGECFYGVLPANGLVYVPPHPCACFPATLMNGFLAYASDHGEKKDKTSGPGLKKGPAYEKVDENAESSTASEWPFYRHDPERTGTAGCSVPANLSVSWRAELKGDLTAPVIANDRLFVFTKDNHTLHCLDAQTGSLLWKKTVDGGVDTPPTIYNGLALFGCNDGSVYCLRASDGALVWQFRAAPGERLIMDEGQLESPWPVHGNVLVIDSLAYFAAGRSSFLDGGIRMYAIRPGTGEIVHQTKVEGPRLNYIEENGGESTKFPAPIHQSYNIQKANGHPYSQEGAKSHLLVTGANKNHIYMGQKAFKLNLEEMELSMPPTGLGRKKLGLHLASQSGFLDDTWFHRTSWRYTRYWPGHTFGSSVPRSGQILVFDKNTTYALRAFNSGGRGGSFMAEEKSGYILCADDNDIPLKSTQESHGLYIERTQPSRWEQKIPVRANAMVLAEDVLFLAGPPNVFPENDPYAALEGRKGARLWAMSIKDGEKLHSYKIENLPVFDGMAAAYNRLYISAHNGEVMCLAPNG